MRMRRYNELDYRWVADDTWTWTASFPSPQPAENATHWLLTIGAVDGVGQVALNGKVLAFPRNSHRPVEADVSGLLAEDGNNTLTVTIESAAAVAAAAAAVYPYQVPAVRQVGGLPHYNFIRKAASDFGWDWGPAFAPACILGDVTLTAYSGPYLTGALWSASLWLWDGKAGKGWGSERELLSSDTQHVKNGRRMELGQ